MNRQKSVLFLAAFALIGLTGGLLVYLRAHQRLGPPAVRTAAQEGTSRLRIELPEKVLDYASEELPMSQQEMEILPQDTSLGRRRYRAPEGFITDVSVVLMGTDRTSMHRPEFCLAGQGWTVDDTESQETRVHLERPTPYELPVKKLVATREATIEGKKVALRGIYVHWFVAQNELTAKHSQCMFWMARDMLRTGILNRWAYVSYFTVCLPGQETATFEKMKRLIAASVPEFQLTPAVIEPRVLARP